MRSSPLIRPLFLALVLALPLGMSLQAQKSIKMENLPNFDMRRFHFGFLLSFNSSDLVVVQDPASPWRDSLLVLNHLRQPGFNLGIISSLNMTDNLSLRFLPSLSFQERQLQYTFKEADGTRKIFTKPVESTYLEFPLLLKFRSNRINNFAVYVIGGGKFGIDMASRKDVNQALDDEIVIKLEKYDYAAEVGGGFDFFLQYFKFGIELKTAIGIPNVLINDDTRFSRPLESLRTRAFFFTLTFEG
jgi:hypothetical protein